MSPFASVAAFACAAALAAAALPYDSPTGGFAFTAPEDWTIVPQSGETFPVLRGPADDDRAPLVVISEPKSADDLFTLGDDTMKEMLKDPFFQLSIRDSFYTADRRVGLKFVLLRQVAGAPYRLVIYLVEGPGARKFTFIASLPDPGWEQYQPILDNMMRSYHLRPGAPPPSAPASPAPAPALPPPPANQPPPAPAGAALAPAASPAPRPLPESRAGK